MIDDRARASPQGSRLMKSFVLALLLAMPASAMASQSSIDQAIKRAQEERSLRGVPAQADVFSARKLSNSITSHLPPNRMDAYAIRLRGQLRDKEYWEICFSEGEEVGAITCMYYSLDDLGFLAVYRSR